MPHSIPVTSPGYARTSHELAGIDTVTHAHPQSPIAAAELVVRWRQGDQDALAELVPQVYDQLRQLAGAYLSVERPGHTLQPTALVNEALLRLLGNDAHPADRNHFFSLAARTMRRILVDHARAKNAEKRPHPAARVTLDPDQTPDTDTAFEVLDLHNALENFARLAPRQAQLVELRYFGGLSNREAAEVLGISAATADRDAKTARVWLRRALSA